MSKELTGETESYIKEKYNLYMYNSCENGYDKMIWTVLLILATATITFTLIIDYFKSVL